MECLKRQWTFFLLALLKQRLVECKWLCAKDIRFAVSGV
jgi:hypothetical protein